MDRDEIIDEELSTLEDVMEDLENEKETVTEVEVSEKALKFKISTEGSTATHRKSCPSSRKGSRERVQHFSNSDLQRAVQRGKLKTGAYSFDHHCLTRNKLSFDAPEFLDEYAIILNNKPESISRDDDRYECLLSKETLNLNKRNSIKTPIKESDGIVEEIVIHSGNLKETNRPNSETDKNLNRTDIAITRNQSTKKPNDNLNNISVENVSVKQEERETRGDSKNSCSIFSRIKKITEQFSFSQEKDKKYKNLRLHLRNTNILTSPCCKSLENIDDGRQQETKVSGSFKGWFFVNKENKGNNFEGWSSDADVYKLSTNQNDNHSLPSTSKSENNCYKTSSEHERTKIDKKTAPNFQIIQMNEPSHNRCST